MRRARRPARTPSPAVSSPDTQLAALLDAAAQADPSNLPRSFADAGLPERLVETLSRRGMTAPFAIQARTLNDALAGRDILGRAQTGSGKTLAFGVPMLALLSAGAEQKAPRGLVLVPTRELAQQVTNALRPLGRALRVRILEVYGGASMGKQISALRAGVDIVVATPGRLLDLIEQGECVLDQIQITVLDEADYMSDLGFMPTVTKLLDLTPSGTQRMLFSATLDGGVGELCRRYLDEPAPHAVASATAPIESVDHRVFVLSPSDKVAVAAEIAGRPGRTLFFVRTKHGADRLAKQLVRGGVPANAIHGNLKQGARTRALAGFSAGAPRVMVATDVAARGIHVDDVDLVVHFDPPGDHKDYLHRSGRTARAGATGTVVSLIHPDQRRDVNRLHRDASVNATSVEVTPGHDAVREVAVSGTPIVVAPRAERERDRDNRRRPERARSERPRTDRARTDRTRSDRTRSERPRTERPRTERPRTERQSTKPNSGERQPASRPERTEQVERSSEQEPKRKLRHRQQRQQTLQHQERRTTQPRRKGRGPHRQS